MGRGGASRVTIGDGYLYLYLGPRRLYETLCVSMFALGSDFGLERREEETDGEFLHLNSVTF